MRSSRILGWLALALFAALLLAPALPLRADDSAGYYTQAQADKGKALFAANCAMCHGANLEGISGPALAGSDFQSGWASRTAADLHDVMSTEMPLTAPGSLKPDEYISLVAFVLSKNGFPAGSTPLDKSKLAGISLKRP
jgi:mono/diheme cytochrome c family protein